ncbi:MAG: SRPBCC domain-containing protein [Oligoflexales bacterium]|nr:SRPBCC domain-containing protein [Oligoflexales bacterium]
MIIYGGKTLRFEREMEIDVDQLFQAWSDGRKIRAWWDNLALVENDFRVGGKYKFQWSSSEDAVAGEYTMIEPNRKIVFTWDTSFRGGSVKNSVITLNFTSVSEKKSKLELIHEHLPANLLDSFYGLDAWTGVLLKFEKYFNAKSRENLKCDDLVVERFLPFPKDVIFKALTTPETMNKWFNRSGSTSGKAEANLKVGGTFRMDYETVDGVIWPHCGEYLEIVPNEKIVFSWTSDNCHYLTKVYITLAEKTNGTDVRIIHKDLFSEEYRKDHHGGWAHCLKRLEAI